MFVPGWPAVFFISGENQRLDDMIGETPGIQTNMETSTLVGLTGLRVFVL